MRHIYLNGTDVTGTEVYFDDWSIEDNMNRRSNLDGTIKKSSVSVECGDEIRFYDDSEYIWGGVIIDLDEEYVDTNKGYLWSKVSVGDFTHLLSRRLITKVFEETYVGDILKYIIDNDLAYLGITAGSIVDGPLINKIKFNYKAADNSIQELVDFGNYVWNIDKDKKLNYYEVGYYTNSTPLENEKGFKRSRSIVNYRNKQYVRGNYVEIPNEIPDETPTPKPDGESKSFFTKYKIGREPTIEVMLASAAWATVDVGIKGLNTGKDFYWSYGSTQITQDDNYNGGNALDSDNVDAIKVTYTGLRPILVSVIDAKEISDNGLCESYITNQKLRDSADALSYARRLLEKYANQADTVSFTLRSKDYEPGEVITIEKDAPWNISEDYFVSSVRILPQGVDGIIYEYKCLDGAALGGWEDFFKNVSQPEVIEESDDTELILVLKTWEDGGDIDDGYEKMSYDGEYNIKVLVPLYPSDSLYPSIVRWPGDLKANDYISD